VSSCRGRVADHVSDVADHDDDDTTTAPSVVVVFRELGR
jgi:hypothetical protein